MSFGFGFALPAYPLRGGGGNNPFNQLGPTLDLSFIGTAGDLSGADTYTLNTDFITPEYQVAAQYAVWENGVGLAQKTFAQIVTFTRASTATYFNSAGTLTSAAVDEARFDYNPSTLAPLGFLIEESRTNIQLHSEDFSNAGGWGVTGATITTNATAAPTGASTADKLVEDTSTGTHQVASVNSVTAGVAYAFSVFAKPAERTQFQVAGMGLTGAGFNIVFTLTGAGSVTGAPAGTTITLLSNGWYRCSIPFTPTNTTPPNYFLYNGTTNSYTGNGTSGLFLWGSQTEAGAFPTSYIPTTTTALTRSADDAVVNTLSPWYSATAGTLFAEYNIPFALLAGTGPRLASLQGAGGPAVDELPLFIVQISGKAASVNAFTAGVNAGRVDATASFATNTTTKAAYAYALNDRAVTTGGSVPTTSATVYTIPTVTLMRLGTQGSGFSQINGYLRRIVYYPRRLSNAELQTITT